MGTRAEAKVGAVIYWAPAGRRAAKKEKKPNPRFPGTQTLAHLIRAIRPRLYH